jgi:hypothetical protein
LAYQSHIRFTCLFRVVSASTAGIASNRLFVSSVRLLAKRRHSDGNVDHEFKDCLVDFIGQFRETKVHSLAEIINFNLEHPELTLPPSSPNQDDLHSALESHFTTDDIAQARENLKQLGGAGGLDRIFDEYGLDIIAAPGDSALCSLAAAAGYPMAVVPLGALKVSITHKPQPTSKNGIF